MSKCILLDSVKALACSFVDRQIVRSYDVGVRPVALLRVCDKGGNVQLVVACAGHEGVVGGMGL